MRFKDFNAQMRAYETTFDQSVVPDAHIVARLDVRGCTRLTRDVLGYEKPYDGRFKDLMVSTVQHLVRDSGFRVVYGYTQSDEISLLLHEKDDTFNRRVNKLISVLASEASAHVSLKLGRPLVFDCRLSLLPTVPRVLDYFRWRQDDARRNALSSHSYYALLHAGHSARSAHQKLRGVDGPGKIELLRDLHVDFDATPQWQSHGVGVHWGQGVETRCATKYTQFKAEGSRSDTERILTVYRGHDNTWVLRSVSTKDGAVLADGFYNIAGTTHVAALPPVPWEHEVPKHVLSDIWRYWAPYSTIKLTQLPNVWEAVRPDVIVNERLPSGVPYARMLESLVLEGTTT